MNLLAFLKPKPTISDQDINLGLRWFSFHGMAASGLSSITTSGFLAAFALALGANNLQIGVLAAIPFIMQILQLPTIWFVEKFRRRKVITVITYFTAQGLWFPIALIPLFMRVPSGEAISLLLILMASRSLFVAVSSCSFNSWLHDLMPQESLGRTFSKYLRLSTAAAVIFSLGAAFFVDFWQGQGTGQSNILGYTYVILFGTLFLGLASPVFMALMPEPLMQPVLEKQPSILKSITTPFRNRNFRQLLQFLLFWGFTSNMVIPFFAVYMLKRLGLPLSWVIGLSILSQLSNMFFIRVWGRLVDKFGSKAILSMGASLFLLVVFGWIFTTMPERYVLTIPLLIILHILAGIALGGIAIGGQTIRLKLAPRGEATSYLAGAALVGSLGAGLGPLCGGLLADFFSTRQLALDFTWGSSLSSTQFPALSIIGIDFLFSITFILGLVILGILARIREEGEGSREVVLESLVSPNRKISNPMNLSPSNSLLSNFTFSLIKRMPVPGLDVAVGVTAYQIAEAARVATLTAARGRKVTKKLVNALQDNLAMVWEDKTVTKEHGVEIAREMARGAIHVVDEKTLDVEQMESTVIKGVVSIVSQAGVDPEDAILGSSQGIIQGATEVKIDLDVAVKQVLETVMKVAKPIGLSKQAAVDSAIDGMLQVSEALGGRVTTKINEYLRDLLIPSRMRNKKYDQLSFDRFKWKQN